MSDLKPTPTAQPNGETMTTSTTPQPDGLMPCPSRPWNVEVKETDHGPLYVVYGSDGRLVGSDTNKEQMKMIVDAVNGYAAPIPSGEPPTEALAVAKRVRELESMRPMGAGGVSFVLKSPPLLPMPNTGRDGK